MNVTGIQEHPAKVLHIFGSMVTFGSYGKPLADMFLTSWKLSELSTENRIENPLDISRDLIPGSSSTAIMRLWLMLSSIWVYASRHSKSEDTSMSTNDAMNTNRHIPDQESKTKPITPNGYAVGRKRQYPLPSLPECLYR